MTEVESMQLKGTLLYGYLTHEHKRLIHFLMFLQIILTFLKLQEKKNPRNQLQQLMNFIYNNFKSPKAPAAQSSSHINQGSGRHTYCTVGHITWNMYSCDPCAV